MRVLLRPWCWLVGHARRFVWVRDGKVGLDCERCGAHVEFDGED